MLNQELVFTTCTPRRKHCRKGINNRASKSITLAFANPSSYKVNVPGIDLGSGTGACKQNDV